MRVLMVGATGRYAHLVVPELVKRGVAVRALVRSEQRAEVAHANGATDTVIGDLSDPRSLAAAVAGLDGASSSCLKMIVAQLMLVCSVVKHIGLLGLSCRCGGNDFVPDREAGGHLGSPLSCTDQMTTGPKVLPDVAESKQEPLSLPR